MIHSNVHLSADNGKRGVRGGIGKNDLHDLEDVLNVNLRNEHCEDNLNYTQGSNTYTDASK